MIYQLTPQHPTRVTIQREADKYDSPNLYINKKKNNSKQWEDHRIILIDLHSLFHPRI